MVKNKKGGGGDANRLGRQLIKNRFGRTSQRKVDNDTLLHTTEIKDGYDWGRLNLSSVTEESSFQEFLRTAELAGTEFQAEKLNITFIDQKQGVGLMKTEEELMRKKHKEHRDQLKIPRRPKWNTRMSATELASAENESFLIWRRELALLQEDEDILMTPYEKNVEFWRQLWRVVERSDVVVQIVDGRNPLLFRSLDLERYVKEVSPTKVNMILVNKSDMLTEEQRTHWAAFFESEGLHTAFFSATLAEEELKRETEAARAITDEDKLSMHELRAAAQELNESLDKLEQKLEVIESKIDGGASAASSRSQTAVKNSPRLLTRTELIEFFRHVYTGGERHTPNLTTIGMVGYPNVGKSSTINALMTVKKVSVSATPGKTKRLQTLFLDKDLMLCDCPGLVMPSFVLTKADMLLNGILPIDHMRDYVPPVNLLCERIPRHVLEDIYGIVIAKPIEGENPERPPLAEELLLAYGYNRGFMTSNGQPDQARSARYLCKDYVNGRLLYSLAPPSVPQTEYHTFAPRQRKEVAENQLPIQQQRAMRINKTITSNELDKELFTAGSIKAHVKGRSNFPHIRVANDGTILASTGDPLAKPWRSVKKERREKLRKKFSHLDEH